MQTLPPPPPSPPSSIPLPATEPPPPPTQVVKPEPESRLDQLAAQYAVEKPRLDELAARVEEIKTAIKTELRNQFPTSEDMLLTSPHLEKPLTLKAVRSWRLDSTALKKAHPAIWVTFAKQITSWPLGGR